MRKIIKTVSIILLIAILCILFACSNEIEESLPDIIVPGESIPDVPIMNVGYKSSTSTFNISDVTLEFFCGSENITGFLAGSKGYEDYSSVTYMIFISDAVLKSTDQFIRGYSIDKTLLQDYYADVRLYDIIETDENIHVCKKISSTDEEPFYVYNKVKREFFNYPQNTSVNDLRNTWANGCKLWYLPSTLGPGLRVSEKSYMFTIPSEFFSDDEGYVFFAVVSFLTEDISKEEMELKSSDFLDNSGFAGSIMEYKLLSFKYSKEGSEITLN